jgi:hypothetical protein
MGRRQITNDGYEQDIHTGWRRLYCYAKRAGAASYTKRRTRRRERREGKTDVSKRVEEA